MFTTIDAGTRWYGFAAGLGYEVMTSFRNLMMGAAGAAGGSFAVDNSAMFDFASAQYLIRTPTTEGNRRTWTWSGWVKRSGLGNPGGPNTLT